MDNFDEQIAASKFGKTIERYDVVSFDVFDTAVVRPFLQPKDIFHRLSALHRGALLHYNFDFAHLRASAESILRKAMEERGERLDPTLRRIYAEMARISGYPLSKLIWIQKLEEQIEVNYVYRNELIHSLYRYALSVGKRVIFITDTYFAPAIIEKMLVKAGYAEYEKIYCSSALGATKKHGEIYDAVLQDIGIEAKQIVHIGDNRHSDCQLAQTRGIANLHFRKNTDFLFDRTSPARLIWRRRHELLSSQSAVVALIGNKSNRYNFNRETPSSLFRGDYYLVGYSLIGPLLFELTRSIYRSAAARGIGTVLYLARDGHLPLKALEAFRDVAGLKDLSGVYTPISRKVLIPFKIADYRGIEILFDLGVADDMNVKAFFNERLLSRVILAVADVEKMFSSVAEEPVSRHREAIFAALKEHEQQIRAACEPLKQNALAYYRANMPPEGRIGLFDVGSKGSFQRFLSKELERDIFGFYVTTAVAAESILGLENYETIYHAPNGAIDHRRLDTQFFESILSSTLPSTIAFDNNGNPIQAATSSTNTASHQILHKIQKGALDFVRDFCLRFKGEVSDMELDLNIFHSMIEQIRKNPEDAVLFTGLLHEDSMYSEKARSLYNLYFAHSALPTANIASETKPIVIYCPAMTRVRGGVERVVSYIAAELDRQGRPLCILTSGQADEYFMRPVYPLPDSVHVRCVDEKDVRSLRQVIAEINPSCVLVMASGPVNRVFTEALERMRVPLALCERADPQSSFKLYWKGIKLETIYQIYGRADLISVQLNSFRQGFPEQLRERIRVHPNPVPAVAQNRMPRENLIVCVARLFLEQKQQHLLITAFARIADKFPAYSIEFYGKDQDGGLKKILQLAKDLGIENRVRYCGVVEDIFSVFRRAKLMVMPSRFEGFPNSLAEGLASGVPAVGLASCPGVNELIKHGVNGLLASDDEAGIAEAIDKILSDEMKWAAMAAESSSVSEEYDLIKCISNWMDFIGELESIEK